jgi:hypothetical protein
MGKKLLPHRFVNLSDLSFRPREQGTLPKHEAVRKALLKDVKPLVENRGPAALKGLSQLSRSDPLLPNLIRNVISIT